MRSLLLALIGALASMPAVSDAREAPTIPPSMIGTWGWSAESCARTDDDGRAIVRAMSVKFYVSVYELLDIVLQQDGTASANALYREEGETGTSHAVIKLKMLTPDRLMVQTESNGGHVYVRCRP